MPDSPIDITEPWARLLTGAAALAAGTLAAAVVPGGTLLAAGIGSATAVAASVLATDVHGGLARRLPRSDAVLANHDLARAVREAIRVVLEEAANQPQPVLPKAVIRRLAATKGQD